jgi:adenylyltransferase/sulfurtransferase
MIDARSLRFETLSYSWDENNPLSGKHPTIRSLRTEDGPRTTENG